MQIGKTAKKERSEPNTIEMKISAGRFRPVFKLWGPNFYAKQKSRSRSEIRWCLVQRNKVAEGSRVSLIPGESTLYVQSNARLCEEPPLSHTADCCPYPCSGRTSRLRYFMGIGRKVRISAEISCGVNGFLGRARCIPHDEGHLSTCVVRPTHLSN